MLSSARKVAPRSPASAERAEYHAPPLLTTYGGSHYNR